MGCPASGCTGYELANDLDYGTTVSNEGWLPIGYWNSDEDNAPFTATFDGNGRTIANLYITRSGTGYIGLFGYTGAGSVIRRVGLTSVNVVGNNRVGGLVGSNGGGAISGSYATGNVIGNQDVGGLAGTNWNDGIITDSYANVVVQGSSTGIGGLVGGNWSDITRSHAAGEVTNKATYTGGLVGYDGGGTITASYSTGNVSVRGHEITLATGGLVGYLNGGSIVASYATGVVNAQHWITYTSRDDNYVGGLVLQLQIRRG